MMIGKQAAMTLSRCNVSDHQSYYFMVSGEGSLVVSTYGQEGRNIGKKGKIWVRREKYG